MLPRKRLSALFAFLLAVLIGALVPLAEPRAAWSASEDKENKPEKTTAPSDAENIDKWIAQLGAESFKEREEAIRRLIAIGPAALGPLRRIADDKHADPDVRLRAARAAFAIATVKIEMVRRLGAHTSGPQDPSFRRATRVALSPDGKHAVTTGADNIRYWDLASGKQIRAFGGTAQGYRSVSFAPDGRTIAAGGRRGNVYLFDVHMGKLLQEMKGH